MSGFSSLFIKRPIATTLLAIGLFLSGAVAYFALPVASLPAVEFPTIRVWASQPGADPATMAATIAAPLERRLGEIAGVSEMSSSNALGSTNISVQFDLSRSIDNAARDVQAALNAAATDLPSDLPTLPMFRKANSAAAPVLILALTSDTIAPSAIYDVADTVVAQRIAQVEGVAEVSVNGAEQPAVRVWVDSARLAAMGVSLDAIRAAITASNVRSPLGAFNGADRSETIATNDQIVDPADYRRIIVKTSKGTAVPLSSVAEVEPGVRNIRAAGWFNRQPAVLLVITKQPNANVIETVDRVRALLPEINRWIPEGVKIAVLSDRTQTIRASVKEIQRTLLITIFLVMMVVLAFLRGAASTLAAGITVPLSLAGTFAAMWVAGFSLDNLSLMAITIAVGFVVDDAIVMIENIHRNLELGLERQSAAIVGARQITFTVISISLSLLAAFIPLLFMDGIVGRLFREFSLTLAFAIVISTLVSLSVTPMICGKFMRHERAASRGLSGRIERWLNGLGLAYSASLRPVVSHPWIMLLVMVATITLTIDLYRDAPKGYFPQDDTGLVFGFSEASPDVSFSAMAQLQQQAAEIVLKDPAVAAMASFIGSSVGSGSVNQGRFFINLKPEAERGLTSAQVVDRLRGKISNLAGLQVYLTPVQDLRAGARVGKSSYQFTLWDPDLGELEAYVPKVLATIKEIPGLVDVATDSEKGGLEARVAIDRPLAARLGVAIQDIDNALGDAFGQKQISTIYSQRNQYRVILGVTPSRQRDPTDLEGLHVPGSGGAQIPLSSVAHVERATSPLVVNHQGQFPSITITYSLKAAGNLDSANRAIERSVAELHLPDGLHAEFAGDAKSLAQNSSAMGVLILAALLAIYIILGILYESLLHPITIISTLPSAGLGALLALRLAGLDLTVIAFIGIILLIGIVKKNGIMLVDFAITAERVRGLTPQQAIIEACAVRFRPILMTTFAALLGALPLALAVGAGSELRRPLGITIVGGLVLSQILTLYTTPIIYLVMARFGRKRRHNSAAGLQPEAT
jgi:hydrophobe/amphiphile efflux-1 (HAE1) family protein